jgi:hypothetical protein
MPLEEKVIAQNGATEDELREAISSAIRASAARVHADILKVWTEG